jgi:hypothetical protein
MSLFLSPEQQSMILAKLYGTRDEEFALKKFRMYAKQQGRKYGVKKLRSGQAMQLLEDAGFLEDQIRRAMSLAGLGKYVVDI